MAGTIKDIISKIPVGYSEAMFKNRKYSIEKTVHNNGKSLKVFARELGGIDFVSFNSYELSGGDKLCPCEMPEEKVLDFLKNYKPIS